MKEGIIVRDSCPVCNSASAKSIFNRSFNEELLKEYMYLGYQGNANIELLKDVSYEILKCNVCKLYYQKHVLDEVHLDELYNKWIDPKLALEWNKRGEIEKRKEYAAILKFAEKQLKKESSNIKVLDYGAGFGESLIVAKEMGYDSYAYEYSTERVQSLEKRGIIAINDESKLKFDLIIVNQVLEHLTYPNKVLNEIVSKLNEEGLIYIAVPNCAYLEKNLKRTEKISDAKEFHRVLLSADVSAFQHINFFATRNLKLLFKNNGLKPLCPIKEALNRPLSIKSFIRPFYYFYFKTTFFVMLKSRKK